MTTDSNPADEILIVGASARAAALSAHRAGIQTVTIDLFADDDLRLLPGAHFTIPRLHIDQLPTIRETIARHSSLTGWFYTGALENSPDVIAAVSEWLPLLGNGPDVLATVRNPLRVGEILTHHNLPVPAIQTGNALPPGARQWLIKPFRSAAGRDVQLWNSNDRQSFLPDECYLQEYIADGQSISAVFLATGQGVELMGVSLQLIGEPALGAAGFTYCGSVGPMPVSSELRDQITQTASCLTDECGLQGLFGIDFVQKGGIAWPVEINPRYPASLEVFERFGNRAWMRDHIDSCRGQSADRSSTAPMHPTALPAEASDGEQFVGKGILYARERTTIPADFALFVQSLAKLQARLNSPAVALNQRWPELADLPAAGTVIEPGHPVCTLFVSADSMETCKTGLLARAAKLRNQLKG